MKKTFCTTTQIIKKIQKNPFTLQLECVTIRINQYSYSTIADKILPIGLTCT